MPPLFLGELGLALYLAGSVALQARWNASALGGHAFAVGFIATVDALRVLTIQLGARLCARLTNASVFPGVLLGGGSWSWGVVVRAFRLYAAALLFMGGVA
jgi:hypothetical protein